jgi:hypothetical protein
VIAGSLFDDELNGRRKAVTIQQPLTHDDLVALIAEVIGRPPSVRFVDVSRLPRAVWS